LCLLWEQRGGVARLKADATRDVKRRRRHGMVPGNTGRLQPAGAYGHGASGSLALF